MAAYRSSATTNIVSKDGAAWSITITKPSGLTAGDYMVAIIGTSSDSSVQDVSGWTTLGSQLNGADARLTVYGKVADSSDAAASNFTFAVHSGNGAANDGMGGCLIAISGTAPVATTSFIDFGTSGGASATHTYSGGITPTVADSILIMGTWGHGSASRTISNYAIATDNPTWTERMDDTEPVGTSYYVIGVATAPRSQTTATGDFSLDYSSTGDDSVGVLLAVLETQSVTVSPSVISTAMNIVAPTVAGGATVTPTVVTMAGSVQAPTVAVQDAKYNNQDKTSASWVNQDKT